MGLNVVDINVFYSTFTNVFLYFCHVFTFFNVFKNIFGRFYIYDFTRKRIVAFEYSEDIWLIIIIITDDVTADDVTGWRGSGVTDTDEKMRQQHQQQH